MRSIPRILTWVIGTFIIVVLCILISIIFSRNPQSFESFVKLAELLISWPIVVAFLAMVILTRFKCAIADLLRNIRSVSFPGGSVQTQPVGPSKSASDSAGGTISLTSEEQALFREYIENLQQRVADYSDQQIDLQKQLSDAQYSSYMWKFSYLNIFYVLNTKRVLRWFSENPSQSNHYFHVMWLSEIPDPIHRATILDVLIHFGMLQVQDGTLSVTEEGEYFLRYIGFKTSAPENTQ